MVWLSSVCDSGECNVYFEIRDLELKYHNGEISAAVGGVVGDGVDENWGEVFIGAEETARILPYWNDDGGIECLSERIDQQRLQAQMIYEAKQYLYTSDIFGVLKKELKQQQENLAEVCQDNKLAA